MSYYIDILSPETFEVFSKSDKTSAGFHEKRRKDAEILKPGDKLICYVTRLSRWVGILEVTSKSFIDESNFLPGISEVYRVRINVNPSLWLSLERSIPISEDVLWSKLSFTKGLPKNSSKWTIKVRRTLSKLSDEDGHILEEALVRQKNANKTYEMSPTDLKKLKVLTVKTGDSKQVTVSIPENEEAPTPQTIVNPRESIRIQALLAEIGERMDMKIWLPKSDKQRVVEIWHPKSNCLLEQLPLNYDDATLKTIENIDVLWIKGRSIVRAFEVEHTTSIYSGILRMADLMALQPNLNIIAHIVAPEDRKEKVFEELTRPVFTYLEKGPLRESCSFLSYDAVTELSKEKRLEYMTADVLEDFAEYAEETAL